mgnify:CR=1 FL=1
MKTRREFSMLSVIVLVMMVLSSVSFGVPITEGFEYDDLTAMGDNGWTYSEATSLTTSPVAEGSKALFLDGDNKHTAEKTFFASDQTDITVSFQWYTGSSVMTSGDAGVILYDQAGTGIYIVRDVQSGDVKFRLGDDWLVGSFPNTDLNWDGWNDVEVVYDAAGNADIFINGIEAMTDLAAGGFIKFQAFRNWSAHASRDVVIDDIQIVPEPATVALLSLGCLFLRKRRV